VRLPIASVSQEQADRHDLINKARGNWDTDTSDPSWAAQLNAFMYSGAYDAETCLRRKLCEPVGGQSVYSYLAPPRSSVPLVLASTAIDSFAFFQDLAVGLCTDISCVCLYQHGDTRTHTLARVWAGATL
jgi:hypothetical protein